MEAHQDTSTLVPPLSITYSPKKSVFLDIFSAFIPGIVRYFSAFSHLANLSPFSKFPTHSHTFLYIHSKKPRILQGLYDTVLIDMKGGRK
jgi:hypothetical protein